jgi:hypothetical protein
MGGVISARPEVMVRVALRVTAGRPPGLPDVWTVRVAEAPGSRAAGGRRAANRGSDA